MGEYADLLEEARTKAAAYMSTAKIYIPKMYTALINESKNISPEDARDRIEKDCIGIWSKRTILDALPDEAKNRERQKSGRLGQKKRNFAAVSAAKSSAPESPAAEIRIDVHGRSTNGESTIDESSKHGPKEQLKAKEPPPRKTDPGEFREGTLYVDGLDTTDKLIRILAGMKKKDHDRYGPELIAKNRDWRLQAMKSLDTGDLNRLYNHLEFLLKLINDILPVLDKEADVREKTDEIMKP